jgi:hypothetical protein
VHLATTGVVVPAWVVIGAIVLVVAGVLLIVLRRRLAPRSPRH